MAVKIGFMQGRLVGKVNGKIQAFPEKEWRHEFLLAKENSLLNIEWTVDRCNIHNNPIYSASGRREILELAKTHKINVTGVTADCCMQRPYWKETVSNNRIKELNILKNLIKASSKVEARIIVVPLVDNGSIHTVSQYKSFTRGVEMVSPTLKDCDVRLAFESDYPPNKLARFIEEFDADIIGVNYDSGNSAKLGYDVEEEWAAYGNRIINVHIKDRLLHGDTVRLGNGNADFMKLKKVLAQYEYDGMCILQTARSNTNDELSETIINFEFIRDFLSEK